MTERPLLREQASAASTEADYRRELLARMEPLALVAYGEPEAALRLWRSVSGYERDEELPGE